METLNNSIIWRTVIMESLCDCAEISELIYWASHPEELEETAAVIQEQSIKFDLSPLIELALATRDEEWFYKLTSKM
jgi:ribonucleotide reductase beta subunit family protein with ferritin-like domain